MNKKVAIGAFVWMLLFFFPMTVFSEENKQPEGFYVNAVLPENQRSETSSYFDLTVKPNDQQLLQLNIVNNTEEAKTFTVQVLDGVTSNTGTINYEQQKKHDETLQYPLSTLVSGPKELTVPSKKTMTADFQLTIPNKEFKGIILGGIKVTEQKKETSSGGITNLFSYVMPIKLRQNEEAVPYKVNFKGVHIDEEDSTALVTAVFQNPQPVIVREASMTTKVYTDKEKLLAEKNYKDLKFAPNTTFSFPIYLGDQPLDAGEYKVEISLTADKLNEKWQKSFSISKKQIEKVNNQFSVAKKPKNHSIYWWVLIVIVVVLILGLILWRYKKNMKEKKAINPRKKKIKRKAGGLLILLSLGGISFTTPIFASEEDSIKSDASVWVTRGENTEDSSDKADKAEASKDVQPKEEDRSNQSKKPMIQKNADKKYLLPQTNETDQSRLFTTICGCLVILSSILLFQNKDERRKTR